MEDNFFTSPKVVNGPAKWEKRLGGRRVLVPTPLLVDELIRKVGKRKLITIKQIREQLAKDLQPTRPALSLQAFLFELSLKRQKKIYK